MAKNREPIKPVEPESSEEEETDATSDEESDPEPTPILKPTIPTTTNKPVASSQPKPESSDSEEIESDDEEEESDPEPVVQKKLQLTPAKRPSEEKKPEPKKPKTIEPDSKIKPEIDSVKKKSKKTVDVIKPADSVSESSKKNMFQRFWTEEDEIVILKGMIEYEAENNSSPAANLDGFLDYIKRNLHSVEVTKDQLGNKIRRLKKKFANNKAKKVRNFAKPYEKEAYELSEKIWGGESGKEVVVVPSAVKSKSAKSVKGNVVAVAENGVNGTEVEVSSGNGEKKTKKVVVGVKRGDSIDANVEKMLRIGEELFEGEEGVKGSKEWRKLEREEMELTLKHMDVMRAKMKLVLDNMVLD